MNTHGQVIALCKELTVGWPVAPEHYWERQQLAQRMEQVISAVGLKNISYDMRPEDLSGGYKRRLALAVQLVCSAKSWGIL